MIHCAHKIMGGAGLDPLKLENQLCFPLYAAARGVVKLYTPLLEAIDLTYTQYVTMMLLWEHRQLTVKQLGERLYLDSGTLTPLLKKLEGQGLVTRQRSPEDERRVIVTLTGAGAALREKALGIPAALGQCVGLSGEEAGALYTLLYKLLEQMRG